MIMKGNYDFILAPIIIIIWVLYATFEEDDALYQQRNPNKDFAPLDAYDNSTFTYYNSNKGRKRRYNSIDSETYKRIVNKCNRGVKITVQKK